MIQSSSIDPKEVAHYEKLAQTWWDPVGPFWPLHRLNELRVTYLRDQFCHYFDRSPDADRPLEGLRILDVGCGGGILSESMARLGASVTGIDVVERNLQIASLHARQASLPVEYRHTTAEAMADAGERFDVVLNMEVVEHVADLQGFMAACGALVAERGLMSVATINRNPLAGLVAIFGAEYILRWLPRGTHQYRKLRRPSEVEACLEQAGLAVIARTGVKVNPVRRSLHLTPFMGINYMLVAARDNAKSVEGKEQN
jgi:2-polyprenyl-6-hydroxyphenyl methylase/3-demethylubiquinone-9 3-methyltransferase